LTISIDKSDAKTVSCFKPLGFSNAEAWIFVEIVPGIGERG
jgi:hypothetical protein